MLSRCANSSCSKPFLRLREGKLFLVETQTSVGQTGEASSLAVRHQPRHVERYWLCDECAAQWTLIYDREEGIALLPLPRPALGTNGGAKASCRESA